VGSGVAVGDGVAVGKGVSATVGKGVSVAVGGRVGVAIGGGVGVVVAGGSVIEAVAVGETGVGADVDWAETDAATLAGATVGFVVCWLGWVTPTHAATVAAMRTRRANLIWSSLRPDLWD
jgi:hypothetical protein